jgi:hypothetical protein
VRLGGLPAVLTAILACGYTLVGSYVDSVGQRQALLVGGGLERDWIGATDKAHRPPLGDRAGSETKGKGRQMVLQQQPAAMR